MTVLVSACLLGVSCRYDGQSKCHPLMGELLQKHTVIPICPEQLGGLSTPRPPAERRGGGVFTREGADVTAAYDPTFADAFEPDNATYAGNGVAIYKYTGARGKSGTSDACAEMVSYLTRLLEKNNVIWQIGEMGKLDLGGGGTVAKYVANQDIDTIDIGVPVLSMHAPFEVVSKADVYMAYLTFKAFCEDAE